MKYIIFFMLIFSQCNFVQSQIFQWEDPVRISNNPEGWCLLPTICDDSNGNLYVAFVHYNHDENNHLYFTWYDGNNWQEVDTLYNEATYDVYNTKILCDNENDLHLSVEIAYGAFGRVYYMKRENNVWSDLLQISVDSLGNNWDHDMVIDNTGKVYIFFHTQDIYYRTIDDTVLSDPTNVTNIEEEHISALEPTVAVNNQNTIYLSYTLKDDVKRVSEIYYREFNGNQWSDPENLSKIDDLSGYEPNITVDQLKNPHVVWRQRQSNFYSILYSTRYKGEWTEPINISDILNSSSYRPKIKLYKNKPIVFFHTVYEDNNKENNYSYLIDEAWSISQFDNDIYTSLNFDYFISDSDTLHYVTRSSPVSNRAYIDYIKGFSIPTSIQELDTKNPESLRLKVYPNPFNNYTIIQFYLNKTDKLDIKIFDVIGKLVKTISSNRQLISGMHLYQWDASNNEGKGVSSGIYLIAFLRNSELVYSQKIILFK